MGKELDELIVEACSEIDRLCFEQEKVLDDLPDAIRGIDASKGLRTESLAMAVARLRTQRKRLNKQRETCESSRGNTDTHYVEQCLSQIRIEQNVFTRDRRIIHRYINSL